LKAKIFYKLIKTILMKIYNIEAKTIIMGIIMLSFALISNICLAQFTVSPNKTAAQLANALTGPGVTVMNATMNCPSVANGTFSGAVSPLGISSGIVLTSGTAVSVDNPASFFASPEDNGTGGDANLTALSGNPTLDACVIEFDFVPLGDSIKFNYQFGSEEYPVYTCSQFNDVFGFFISGPGYGSPTNIAKVPGTNIPVAINSINSGSASPGFPFANCTGMGAGSPFPSFFINNVGGGTVAYDGLTRVLTAKAAVTPCATYHFKLGVADATDHILSSGVFLQEGSLTVLPPVITGCPSNIGVFTGQGNTKCGQFVSWIPPKVQGNCLNVTVTSNHNPGDFFPVGTTTVTYTFTNAGGSSTCTFTVTVKDNTPPVASCKNFVLNLSGGVGTVTPADINNGSFDNCGIKAMEVIPNTFKCSDAGNNSVTLVVVDNNGNVSSCTANVLVQYQPSCSVAFELAAGDYTGGAPNTIFLGYGPQSANITVTATGGSGFTYSWSPSTNLSCSNCANPVFTPTAQGIYTFTVTVTNSNGCSTTCSVSFCVLDIRDPNHANKVYICHTVSPTPGTLSVATAAVAAHLAHGDYLGQCGQTCESISGSAGKGGTTQAVSGIKVYPNPVLNTFTIQLPANMKGAEANVLDITGKVVQRKSFADSNILNFDMSNNAKGVYTIEVIEGNEVHRIKVVKE
jgi:hypothetical protein